MAFESYYQYPKTATFPLEKFRVIQCENLFADAIISGSTYIGIPGTANASGFAFLRTGDAIAHGLQRVPNWVGLYASGSIPAFMSCTLDSNFIIVHHTVGGLLGVFWHAEV